MRPILGVLRCGVTSIRVNCEAMMINCNLYIRIQLGQGLEVNYEGTAVQLPYHREFVSIWLVNKLF